MSPTLLQAITLICSNATNIPNSACINSLKAASMQTQFATQEETVEKAGNKVLEIQAYNTFNNTQLTVIGGTIFIAHTIQMRSLSLPLPNLGVCDKMDTSLGINSYGLHLFWIPRWLNY